MCSAIMKRLYHTPSSMAQGPLQRQNIAHSVVDRHHHDTAEQKMGRHSRGQGRLMGSTGHSLSGAGLLFLLKAASTGFGDFPS